MSPRKKEDNELIKEKRKEQILDVSLRLFANLGYESTSISRIAKEAGISKGLLYNYFESKEALLKSLVLEMNHMEETYWNDIQDENPKQMLENVFSVYFKLLVESRDKLKLITALAYQVDKFQFIQDLVSQKTQAYLSLFEDLLIKMKHHNPKEEAMLIGVIFDGIAAQYLIVHGDYPLKELESYLIKKYIVKYE